jgi:hypothetical protein
VDPTKVTFIRVFSGKQSLSGRERAISVPNRIYASLVNKIWQLSTCLRPTPLKERSPFSGFAFWTAGPRLLAQNRQIGRFGDIWRLHRAGRIKAKKAARCCRLGLSADNHFDTAVAKQSNRLGQPKGSAHRDHYSALQEKVTLFRVCHASRLPSFEVPMTEPIGKL